MFSILMLLLLNLSLEGRCTTYDETDVLLNSLLSNYNSNLRPVLDQNDAVDVSIIFRPFAISQLDEIRQTISVSGGLFVYWTDERFVWNASDHNNITMLNPTTNQVWVPILGLANDITGTGYLIDPTIVSKLSIYNTGYAYWVFTVAMESHCKMILTKFPYDKHTCHFEIYPVTYTASQVNLTPASANPDLTAYTPSGEWELVSSEMTISNYTFLDQVFGYVLFSLTIQHKPTFFVVNLLFPTCALSLLNILVFILPADSGEKVGYSITVLLSVMLFMGVTSEFLPPTSDVVPLITQYLTLLTVISVLSVVATVIILIFHHAQDKQEEQENIFLSLLGKLKTNIATRFSKWKNFNRPLTQVEPSGQSQLKDLNRNPVISNGHILASKINDVHEVGTERNHLTKDHTIITKEDENVQRDLDCGMDEQETISEVINMMNTQNKGDFLLHDKTRDNPRRRMLEDDRNDLKEESNLSTPVAQATPPQKPTRKIVQSTSLDTICFVVFLTLWCSITIGYMIALFK